MLSIIVPVLDEAENLERLLPHLRARCPEAEVIVVDGGSGDRTALVARAWPHGRYLVGECGRARQMNAGARAARGDIFLFLHADTRLPAGAAAAIVDALADPAVAGGRFDVRFSSPRWPFRVIAAFMNRPSRLHRWYYGPPHRAVSASRGRGNHSGSLSEGEGRREGGGAS